MPNERQTSTADWIRFKNTIMCKLVGHDVDNSAPHERCMCEEQIFREDGSYTRIRSNISCFMFFHRYIKMCERHGHHEYVCVYCGHTLLFQSPPENGNPRFTKRVAYLCNLRGHGVHEVAERDGYVEYTCDDCGHPFLKTQKGLTFITHLPTTMFGHHVRFVARRNGYAEFLCRDSGHPFCILVDAARSEI